jgi:hypothetical protein
MGGHSPEVDAANAGNGALSIESSGTGKRRDDLEGVFEFIDEHVGVVAIGQPPGLFSSNVFRAVAVTVHNAMANGTFCSCG